jgi:pimeloyl-ACP methyl ester carboxylesterase
MGYVDVAGLATWHEVDGDGDPVVLLHGGFAGASSWSAQLPALLGAGFRVYRPERRAHVHTPDVEGPLTYEVMAADTIAYLEQEVGRPAHLVGWSDGAVVAMLIALQKPELIDRMVLIGQYYNESGKTPSALFDMLVSNRAEAVSFLRREYDQVSPDGPEHFPVVYDKLLEMIRNEPQIDLDSLASVPTPTLFMQGDRDEVSIEHSVAVSRALADARLAVVPGTHLVPMESPEVVNAVVVQFLLGGPPAFL